jgi:hypothetical protein
MSDATSRESRRITLDDDVLIPDRDFREEYLNNATSRTGRRYDRQGLPYVRLNGLKMRPVKRCAEWIANRIQQL